MHRKNSVLPADQACKWIVTLALPSAVYFGLQHNETLTQPMIAFFALTLWAVTAWALNTLNEIAVALLLPILYVLCCGIDQRVVLAPWLSDVPIMVIGGFIIGRLTQLTGLGKRIALVCVKLTGGSFAGALAGITLFRPPSCTRPCPSGLCFCCCALPSTEKAFAERFTSSTRRSAP